MERAIERLNTTSAIFDHGIVMIGRIDARSLWGALIGAAGFFVLASLSLSLSKFDSTLASVWLPNAGAVAFLLRARLANEAVFYAGVLATSILANSLAGTPVGVSAVFSLANTVDIVIVTGLTRRSCGLRPDMTRLPDLARFVLAGGLVGPILAASIASIAMGPDNETIWTGATSWFLTDSMGMVLIVPTVLLVFDAINARRPISSGEVFERFALLLGGMACTYLVFQQNLYPLLFLIPPITLLHAFRLGSLGTALFVGVVAFVTTAMTWAGHGPIAQATLSATTKLHLIQAFVAANFLTGLPIAAILAGRARIVDELEAGKRQLDMLANNITDAVLRYDLDGICTYASPSVANVLGEEPDAFIGHRPIDRMHEDARERIQLAQKRLLTGESDNERFTYRRLLDSEEGTPVFIEADCAIATDPQTGERLAIVVSARDVTERVELELLLTRARRHAENAARAKSEFLANMSHEIRTPMNGVLGFAELMLQEELDPHHRRHTEMIVQSGRSMMLLLNDILDLSKIEAGQIAIDTAPVDIHETLSECVALHRPTAEKKGIELRLEEETHGWGEPDRNGHFDHPTGWVMTDGLRLRQIVLNLIGNAVKFTESGMINVAFQIDEDQLSVRVLDTGIGISPERLDTIFAPFTQGENDTARRFGGTGLGLTISRQLAELLGGYLDVESEAGVGSCFTLTLPARVAEAPGEAAGAPKPIALADLPHHARILLAEDHDVNRILVTEMLERCGQSVAIAHDGNEAISMVIDSVMRGSPYDLVLMDIQMPGCDGYAATRAIRAEGIGPDTLPIIALTANAFPEDIATARDAGMQGHLAKPMVFADLARALQRWLPTRIVEAPSGKDHQPSATENTVSETHTHFANDGVVDFDHASNAVSNDGAPPGAPPQVRSPELIERWQKRRREAVEAVREALKTGALRQRTSGAGAGERDALARLVHKLAGTAAMFGEAELGDHAAALERALRMEVAEDVQEALAHELVNVADENSDGQAQEYHLGS